MAKRVLWLLNHTTLRAFEVPMLLDMGFEVFCPKIFSLGDLSGTSTYQYDATLTIPPDVLQKLNGVDFYGDIPTEIQRLLNQYFDVSFCMFITDQAKIFAKFFKGKIIVRWFGALRETSYTRLHFHDTLELFRMCGNQFWFGIGYDNLSQNECEFLQNRSIHLPIGLHSRSSKCKWIGGDPRMLFVCPKIMTDDYYFKVYDNFKRDFSGIPCVIGGHQMLSVPNDDRVVGYLPENEYEYNMTHLACMFYHSREKYHLHYHPLEAMDRGMPVIFMGGGMLDYLSGGAKMPGCCATVAEAKNKISRLLKGDKILADEIIRSQERILELFSRSYCEAKWRVGLARILDSDPSASKNLQERAWRIGLILPLPYLGGVLDVAKRFSLALKTGVAESGRNIKLVFGYPQDVTLNDNPEIEEIRRNGIECREFRQVEISPNEIETIQKLRGVWPKNQDIYPYGVRCILDDGAHGFEDCDYLIYIVDRSGGAYPVFSEKPYAMIIHDCIQRYMPDSIPPQYKNMITTCYREADHLFALSKPAQNDCIHFGNIAKDRVSILPLMYDLVECDDSDVTETLRELKAAGKDYFLWATNTSPHKNHIRAFNALAKYYEKGGKLDCYITGSGTQYLDPVYARKYAFPGDPHVNQVHEVLRKNSILKKHVHFVGNLRKEQYITLLLKAKFFFHPGYADNGNMGFFDAACLGVPSLSHDYPAMRYCAEFTGIPVCFMDAFSQKDITSNIFLMEKTAEEFAQKLPPKEALARVTIKGTWPQIFNEICHYIGI